ncbi:hypothetical protein Tco_0105916 [Tanacetum coccineum]
MTTTAAQQVALDNVLVPLENRVEIGKCNLRIDPTKTQKEPTYQVVLDALALTTCYPAFLITADVSKIYMHQFWFTINKKDSTLYRFKIDKKRFTLNMEMKKLSPSSRNLDTKETLNLSLKRLLIICTNHGEPLLQSSTSMEDSRAYKTYLAYATRAATLKKARKLKKHDSPSKKRTLTPIKAEISKGIDLLSDAALLEEAYMKKVLRRSHHETMIHQAGGLGDGTDSTPRVPDEPKGKFVDTHEGTGLKPRVPDVSTADSSERENESWGDSGDEANEKGDDDLEQANDELTVSDNLRIIDEEEETQDDEYVHTPEDYVPTDDETNNESKDVDEEEYERISEELYGDVNVRLTDVQPDDEEKGDKEMTNAEIVDVEHENVNQEGAGNQVKDDAQATQKTKVPLPSSFISSDYAAKFLNFDNIPLADTEVVFMLDINVQHEVPRTSPLLTIPVSIIREHNVINPSKIITTTSAITMSSLLSSLFPFLQQSTPIPTLTTTEATILTTVVPDSETLTTLHQRIVDLEKDVKELKDVNNFTTVISTIQSEVPKAVKEYLGSSLDDQYAPPKSIKDIREIKMEHARKQQVPKESITSSDTTALE